MDNPSRRTFLIGAAIAGATLAGGGFAKGMLDPAASSLAQFPEGSCAGTSGEGPRVLIAYASEFGTTSGVAPLAVGRFAGALDYELMSPLSRGAARIVCTAARVGEGDYRDSDTISAWATDSAAQLR